MAVARRGVVFTLIAIVASALLISMYAVQDRTDTTAAGTVAASTRVSLMNAFITTVEQHAAQSLASAGYFTLQRMSEKVHDEGTFLADTDAVVRSCIVDNEISLSGSPEDCMDADNTVNDSLASLASLASSELAITMTYEIENAWVTEADPMEVVFWLNLSVNISDAFASWEVVGDVINVTVAAGGVPDPFFEYLNGTGETTERRNFTLAVVRPSQFNLTVFDEFYANRSYILWQAASPSVLNRYEGNTSPSVCCGIESVIRRENLTLQRSVQYGNFSMVDHHFVDHILDGRPPYDCTAGEVNKLRRGPVHLVLEDYSFDNPYNLTGSADHEPDDCAWP